jgi:hypothetical protein
MKTTELIKLLETNDVTTDQGYNLLIADLWNIEILTKPPFEDQPGESHIVTEADMASPEAQAVIMFFMYQIQEVLLPVIANLRRELRQVQHAGQIFKDELDQRDASVNSILKTEADVYLNNRIDGALKMIESHHHDYEIDSARVRDSLQDQIDGLKRFRARVGQ